jgi:hypothetical protein
VAKQRPQNLEEYYQNAKRALQPFALRTAELEREYATEWMASCASYQDALNEALQNIEDMKQELLAVRTQNEALRREVASRDKSFRPPPVGLA